MFPVLPWHSMAQAQVCTQTARACWHQGHHEILAEGAQYELQEADQKGRLHVPLVNPVLSASTILY